MPRTQAQTVVTIDLIQTKIALGELVKLGVTLGYEVRANRGEDEQLTATAILTRGDPIFLIQEIARLVGVECLVQDAGVDSVLSQVRGLLEGLHFPMSGSPSDSPGLGEGHIDGVL